MPLAPRLADLITALGADVKALFGRSQPPGGATGQVLKKNSTADYDSSWQNESGGGGITPAVHVCSPVPVAGFAHLAITASGLSTIAAAANRLDFMPFIPKRTYTYDQMSVEVTTAVAASSAYLGIYADNAGIPGALIIQGAPVLCATVGDKVTPIAPTVLTAGTPYWLAIASSATQTYRGVPVASLLPLAANATVNAIYALRRAVQAFAALPLAPPSSTPASAIAPHIRLRRSA